MPSRYADAINLALADAMAADSKIVLIGEEQAVGSAFGVTKGLAAKFGPDRVRDMPISEAAFMGMAAGAALTGLRPVVEIMFADFLTVAFDPLMNQIAQARDVFGVKMPLMIRCAYGAGDRSGPQHSQAPIGLLCQIPGLVIGMPGTADDAYSMTATALKSEHPTLLLEHKMLYGTQGLVNKLPVPVGQAVFRRPGKRLTIAAYGLLAYRAEQALDRLGLDDIAVIDLRWATPLDLATVAASAKETGALLLLDESPDGGLADKLIGGLAQSGALPKLCLSARR